MRAFVILAFLGIVFGVTVTESSSSSSTRSSVSPTLVWATGTDALGNLVTSLSIFTQLLRPYDFSPSPVSTGSIGLGTIKGTVGEIREYETKHNEGNVVNSNAFMGILAIIAMI